DGGLVPYRGDGERRPAGFYSTFGIWLLNGGCLPHCKSVPVTPYWKHDPQRTPRLHVDRAVGGNRDHCDIGGDAFAGVVESQAKDRRHFLHEQPETTHHRFSHVPI